MSGDSKSQPAAFEALTVRYGRAKTAAADRVSLSVPRGSVFALLGRNGAGKTSLVRCVLGQQKPTEGRALLFGEDSWKTRARAMERVGVVPEEPDAPPEMTPRQLQRFCSRFYERWDSAGVENRLGRFGVPLDLPFGKLSKGQKGEAMLSLALGHGPELLVMDDPTLGLDAIARRELFEELVGELAERGTTVFVTTHDLAGIEGIADRIGVLTDGVLVLDEDIETLKSRFRRIRYANSRDEARSEYGKELDAFEALRVRVRGWGIEALVANYDDLSFERFRSIPGVVDAEASALSLEEIFAAVAGEARGKNP
jgi:ABC-type multidrug transport system ATPase subunit